MAQSLILSNSTTCQCGATTTFNASQINYNHFIVSSNQSAPFEIHKDERRFFAVRVSSAHVRDNAYFNSLVECIDMPEVARRFYDMLMGRDISSRDWKNPPHTDALDEWKHSCESDVVQFLEHYKIKNPDVSDIKSSELFASYRDYCREYRREGLKMRQFGIEIKRLLGDPVHDRTGNYYKLQNSIVNTA